MDQQWISNGLTMNQQWINNGLTMDWQRISNGLEMGQQWISKGLAMDQLCGTTGTCSTTLRDHWHRQYNLAGPLAPAVQPYNVNVKVKKQKGFPRPLSDSPNTSSLRDAQRTDPQASPKTSKNLFIWGAYGPRGRARTGRERTGPAGTGARLDVRRPSDREHIASRAHAASLARTHERNETISRLTTPQPPSIDILQN